MTGKRDTPFSYQCHACGRCCYHKRIQLNPYEILRLSGNLGVSAEEFLSRYVEHDGPYLRVNKEGACVFLEDQGCSVHPDRPLVCRVYPLGRHVSPSGEESFTALAPHPESEGVYGEEGTIGQFLGQQGITPYTEIWDRYLALFHRMFGILQSRARTDFELVKSAPEAMFAGNALPAFMEWLDADRTVGQYCSEHRLDVPSDPAGKAKLHIAAIDAWLDELTGESHEKIA